MMGILLGYLELSSRPASTTLGLVIRFGYFIKRFHELYSYTAHQVSYCKPCVLRNCGQFDLQKVILLFELNTAVPLLSAVCVYMALLIRQRLKMKSSFRKLLKHLNA
ncbi:hypothetical protein BDB01DRAFT_834381 [Pilobolus umbonatus]|nr:hypothetical protein BDB01DRAFT_834381 [Pilobolus umbonatus]